MKKEIKDSIKSHDAKINDQLTKKYSGKIIFKEKYDRVKAYFKERDLEKEVEKALRN